MEKVILDGNLYATSETLTLSKKEVKEAKKEIKQELNQTMKRYRTFVSRTRKEYLR